MSKDVELFEKERLNGGSPVKDSLAHAENPQNPELCEEKKRTVGNKIFDWGVYSAVAFIGVTAVGLVITHEAKYGKLKAFDWLRKGEEKGSKVLSEKVFGKLMKGKPQEHIDQWSRDSTMFAFLATGGTLLMPIIKYMEDNRQKLASKIDNMLGTTPPDPDLVAKEPKQSWLSVMSGRAASVAVSYSAFATMGPKNADKASRFLGGKVEKAIMKAVPTADATKVGRFSHLVAFDAIFTAFTAAVTYAAARIVAKKHDKTYHKECEPLENPPAEIAPAIAEQPPARPFTERVESRKKMALDRAESFVDNLAMSQSSKGAQAAL